MAYTVTSETFASLAVYWQDPSCELDWQPVFITPVWMETWWREFGGRAALLLKSIRASDKVVCIAPLQVRDGAASFIGSSDVCDYFDFVARPGARDFWPVLFDDLRREGIRSLDLAPVRASSVTIQQLVPLVRQTNPNIEVASLDVSIEVDLPDTWDEYLGLLSARDRHELERKIRRARESGVVTDRWVTAPGDVPEAIDIFLRLFASSRADKAAFLTGQRESFFRALAHAMAEIGSLRIGFLELDAKPVAAVLCFDYKNRVYLYNSGYDPDYRSISAGLVCKALAVKDGIRRGKRVFDFLRGGENYKYRLGGREVPLYHCRIHLA